MNDQNFNLTKRHFSTKVYRCYFHYLRKHHPSISIPDLCRRAGLSYEHVSDENNWVSSLFDARITRLMIEATGEPDLCYKAGVQQVSEEVMGRMVFRMMRYAVSVQFVMSQLGKLTALFNTVTRVTIVRRHRGFVHLQLSVMNQGMSEEEKAALESNFGNIFQNTLGHYTAVPTCQDLPPARIAYFESVDERGSPVYDLQMRFTPSPVSFELALFFLSQALCLLAVFSAWWSFPENEETARHVAIGAAVTCWIVFLVRKTMALRRGFELSMEALDELGRRYEDVQRTKEKFQALSASYARFVPKEFLKLMGRDSVIDVKLGDSVEVDITVLFSDIRQFTSLSETMTPRENFLFLNSYLQRISPIIGKNNGFIDKYIGDGIMAIFPGSPKDAIYGGIAMIRTLRVYNSHRRNSGYKPIHIGVGINSGKAILGTIGNSDQMSGTVIANSVNVAARMEELTKAFGCSILVSERALGASGLMGSILTRSLGHVRVRGTQELVAMHEIYHGDPVAVRMLHSKTKPDFESGVRYFEDLRIEEARRCFAKVLAENPDDKAALYFLRLMSDTELPMLTLRDAG